MKILVPPQTSKEVPDGQYNCNRSSFERLDIDSRAELGERDLRQLEGEKLAASSGLSRSSSDIALQLG